MLLKKQLAVFSNGDAAFIEVLKVLSVLDKTQLTPALRKSCRIHRLQVEEEERPLWSLP